MPGKSQMYKNPIHNEVRYLNTPLTKMSSQLARELADSGK
jgi:hypothetical protein